ncbi:MAG TPA: cytochrome c3 family protein [Syntrophales bacterium]|nr:cytochrome c3 family protein [Syntrophales bacterium]HOX95686.1 cytochrome c3 family protein [Syntrophales bacterium]HPI56921.1 cytochrome c3 family protein [Syntrophales bacterium]HPN23507.1 cytochrome c3 family protein [Syntrophales bacterium]HQM27968.1 cytochrome c3 family protein [Syntrophales bacterium]
MRRKKVVRGGLSTIIVLVVFALSLVGTLSAQDKKPLADRHKDRGLDCAVCHKEPPPAKTTSESCMMCHGDAAKMAERTKDKTPNPHAMPKLDCILCHPGHK